MNKLLITIIKIYQIALSPFFGQQCRFAPTCSHYAIESIQVHGVVKGLFLMIKRLSRCHPWCVGGYDPVPSADSAHAPKTCCNLKRN
jgi:uncharacterized protein